MLSATKYYSDFNWKLSFCYKINVNSSISSIKVHNVNTSYCPPRTVAAVAGMPMTNLKATD